MKKVNKAPVEIVMPEVKLTVADLAYMTGLLPGADAKCLVCGSTHDLGVVLEFMKTPEEPELTLCQNHSKTR